MQKQPIAGSFPESKEMDAGDEVGEEQPRATAIARASNSAATVLQQLREGEPRCALDQVSSCSAHWISCLRGTLTAGLPRSVADSLDRASLPGIIKCGHIGPSIHEGLFGLSADDRASSMHRGRPSNANLFDHAVQFRANENRDARLIEPEHRYHSIADGTVCNRVVTEIRDVELEGERTCQPESSCQEHR